MTRDALRWLLLLAVGLLAYLLARKQKRAHYFMASVAALGIVFLTIGHVWSVIGTGQSLIDYAFLFLTGIDHFRKGRSG